MSDANRSTRMSLGDALRALPAATPPRDGWERLAAEISPAKATARRYMWPLSLAAAAAIAFAVALPHMRRQSAVTTPTAATTARPHASIGMHGTRESTNQHAIPTVQSERMQLASLQERSQSLERWLRRTRDAGSPLQGQDLAAATEIENLIALVDVELTVPAQTHAVALWRRRVGLLEDLAVLRYSNYQLAAGGERLASRSRID